MIYCTVLTSDNGVRGFKELRIRRLEFLCLDSCFLQRGRDGDGNGGDRSNGDNLLRKQMYNILRRLQQLCLQY